MNKIKNNDFINPETEQTKNSVKKQLRIAYLTTEYPAVSHTFIRRELREIERRGHKIFRIALRSSNSPLKDPTDIEESQQTIYCLSQSIFMHLFSLISIIFTHPLLFIRALRLTFKMSSLSYQGYLKHIAYLLEASTL